MSRRTYVGVAAVILAAALFVGCLGDDEGSAGAGGDRGLSLTVNSEDDPWDPGNPFMIPDQGLKLVRYNVTVENMAGEAVPLNLLFFELVTEKGNIYTSSLWSDSGGPEQLADGASYTLSLVFEIEQDDAGATLRYETFGHEASIDL